VFVDGVAERSRYRSFKVKRAAEAPANDDFASMYEILSRRLHRALEGDESWAVPDLLVIDGGKGQLGRAVAALQDLGIPTGAEGVDVVALAKERRGTRRGREALLELQAEGATSDPARPGAAWEDRVVARDQDPDAYEVVPERVFVVGAKEALALRAGSSERHLMERIRDEAHRFAITHHRKRRSRRAIESRLDDIPGIGPELKRALVRHFGSISAIRGAELDALRAVRGVGARLAQRIHDALRTDAG
jgi:excinuclease ABC subunit C